MKVLRFILLFVVIGFVGFLSCKKEEEYVDVLVTGYDWRFCDCCGGYMVTTSDNPEPYEAEFYLVESFPSSFVITPDADFPLELSIRYNEPEPCGDEQRIEVTAVNLK